MPNVAFTHTSYDDLLPIWTKIRDCIAGQEKVKSKKDVYLPRPNPADMSAENLARYDSYVQRAVFYNFTGRTHAGMVGQVMSEDPKVDLPTEIELFNTDIDGEGVGLAQQATETLGDVIAYGRAGLLADYPVREEGQETTVAELRSAEIRPTITTWNPWDIINWRTIKIGGQVKLCLVVLTEEYVTDDDGFETETDKQWRVLRLDEQGLYVMEEWIENPWKEGDYIIKPLGDWVVGGTNYLGAASPKEDPDGKYGYEKIAQYFPTDAAGKRMDYIPFCFIGVRTNSANPSMPPLRDLANLNIAHYCNSADYEESTFMVGQPTPVLTGLTEDWVRNVLKGIVALGSRAAIPLPEGASASLLQPEPNLLPKEAMEHKERQAQALGARLTEMKTVQRTATEASADAASETSILSSITNNVSAAYRQVMWYAQLFINATAKAEDISFQLNTVYTIVSGTAQERAQIIAEWMQGAITDEEMRASLRRARVAFLTDEEWQEKREQQALTKGLLNDAALSGTKEEDNPTKKDNPDE